MKNQTQNQHGSVRRARQLLAALFLLMPLALSACSIDTSSTGTSTTPGAGTPFQNQTQSQAATATPALGTSASSGTGSSSGGDTSNSAPDNSQANQPAQQSNQGGAAWQVPAEQQAVVQVVKRAGPAVVTVVNKLDASNSGFGGEALGSG